jgi:hypothetical protein
MNNDRTQQRYERFAQLRAAYPDADYDEIMLHIHDEEVETDEATEGRRILAAIEA